MYLFVFPGQNTYNLKMKASRTFLGEVNKRFPIFPFSLRSVNPDLCMYIYMHMHAYACIYTYVFHVCICVCLTHMS